MGILIYSGENFLLLVEIRHLIVLDRNDGLGLTRLGSCSGSNLAAVAVPCGRTVNVACLGSVDPGLNLCVICICKALEAIRVHCLTGGCICVYRDIIRLRHVEHRAVTYDLALDVVVILVIYEGFNVDADAGLGGQDHDLRVVQVLRTVVSGLAVANLSGCVVIAEQPAQNVNFVNHRVLNRHGVIPVIRNGRVAVCTVQQECFAVLAAVNGRLELLVALVIAAHEANLNQLLAGLDLRLYDALAGIGFGSQRLFAEHILACRDGSQNVLFMVRVCCGAHYSVDFRIVNHVDGIFKAFDAVLLGNGQAERNRADFLKNNDLYQSSILRLTEHIRNCMQVQQQPNAVSARQGHVDSQRIWRLPVLKDGKVFLRSEEENNPGFTVDLLLDGSASRLHCQETIAAQGYILARSLATCGIPVRVSSFCSLRGYTVVRILKDFSEKNAERKIFNYFAAGWNRDGLALRMAGKLLDTAPADQHLLILLTDASPDDSRKILPTGKVPLSRSYDGEAGVQDTAEEVRALRQQGVRVAAVFMGENVSASDARTIYGQDLVRIQRMDQLAAAAGKLIQEEIRELSE